MQLLDEQGQRRLQAFRLDNVNSSLADLGPTYNHRPLHAPTRKYWSRCSPRHLRKHIGTDRGNLVNITVELWIDRKVKRAAASRSLWPAGMLLALLRWNPDAIWAWLARPWQPSHLNRMGFSYIERGFLQLASGARGADDVEWDRNSEASRARAAD